MCYNQLRWGEQPSVNQLLWTKYTQYAVCSSVYSAEPPVPGQGGANGQHHLPEAMLEVRFHFAVIRGTRFSASKPWVVQRIRSVKDEAVQEMLQDRKNEQKQCRKGFPVMNPVLSSYDLLERLVFCRLMGKQGKLMKRQSESQALIQERTGRTGVQLHSLFWIISLN